MLVKNFSQIDRAISCCTHPKMCILGAKKLSSDTNQSSRKETTSRKKLALPIPGQETEVQCILVSLPILGKKINLWGAFEISTSSNYNHLEINVYPQF